MLKPKLRTKNGSYALPVSCLWVGDRSPQNCDLSIERVEDTGDDSLFLGTPRMGMGEREKEVTARCRKHSTREQAVLVSTFSIKTAYSS